MAKTIKITEDGLLKLQNELECLKTEGRKDIAEKMQSVESDFESYEFKVNEDCEVIPTGIRTEIRRIMQKSFFVIPDKRAVVEGFERIKEIRSMLMSNKFKVDTDYVEAKSLATSAYLILKEVI